MTGSSGLSRPSSGLGNRREDVAPISKDPDESAGPDDSMSLSSPTTHIHPLLKEAKKTDERGQEEIDDVSMDEGDDKLTSEMKADERREKLRRRTSRKNDGGDEDDGKTG